jgi:hypothetical protein
MYGQRNIKCRNNYIAYFPCKIGNLVAWEGKVSMQLCAELYVQDVRAQWTAMLHILCSLFSAVLADTFLCAIFLIWNTSQKMRRAAERQSTETPCYVGNLSSSSVWRDSLNKVLRALLLFLCRTVGTDECNTGLLWPEAIEEKKHETNWLRHYVLRRLHFI